MVETEKKHGLMDMISDGLGFIPDIISAGIFSPIISSTEKIMNNIEERMTQMENRILKDISFLFVIGFGGVFLVMALFSFLTESAGWSDALAYFSIGITIFMIGLMLRSWTHER